jgi:hypothetical protein
MNLNLYLTKEYSPSNERVLVVAESGISSAVFLHGSLATISLPETFSVVSDSLSLHSPQRMTDVPYRTQIQPLEQKSY